MCMQLTWNPAKDYSITKHSTTHKLEFCNDCHVTIQVFTEIYLCITTAAKGEPLTNINLQYCYKKHSDRNQCIDR